MQVPKNKVFGIRVIGFAVQAWGAYLIVGHLDP